MGKMYTVSSSNCPRFSCTTSNSLLMLTTEPRGQFPRWCHSRKRLSVCSVLSVQICDYSAAWVCAQFRTAGSAWATVVKFRERVIKFSAFLWGYVLVIRVLYLFYGWLHTAVCNVINSFVCMTQCVTFKHLFFCPSIHVFGNASVLTPGG
jgi:hypothetical protein